MPWVPKGWSSPEGYPAVSCSSTGAAGYQTPNGTVIDGSGMPLSCPADAAPPSLVPVRPSPSPAPRPDVGWQCWDGCRNGVNATYYDADRRPIRDGFVATCPSCATQAQPQPKAEPQPQPQPKGVVPVSWPGDPQKVTIGGKQYAVVSKGSNDAVTGWLAVSVVGLGGSHYLAGDGTVRDGANGGVVATLVAGNPGGTAPTADVCPSLVPGGSYRPTNSQARYVFTGGKLHLIPDEETARRYGWTDWLDAPPSCFTRDLIGDPIPTVKGSGGSGGSGGTSGGDRAPIQCAAAPATCPAGQTVGIDANSCPACVPADGGPFAWLNDPATQKTLVIAGGGLVALLAVMQSAGPRRR